MCGVSGYISKEPIPTHMFENMNNSMKHRGPDDSGIYVNEQNGYTIGLGHRRLAIIDLSAAGHQPMFSKDKTICIVFNGEIYNYLELKAELLQMNHEFISDTDTEVIINGYKEWGIKIFEKLNGMFALAIYDVKKETVILARDRVGKKPLYYFTKGTDFVFASELKPIMKYPKFQKNIRKDILARYLYHQYIQDPDTIFEDTYKLEPGKYLIWKSGTIRIEAYWSILEAYNKNVTNQVLDYKEAKEGLTLLVEDAVKKRMISDVPIGSFLSGGIDSSLITALAQKNSSTPIQTFCIGFNEKEYDESIYAKEIANYLGTDHHELVIDETKMLAIIESIPIYYDEPFADSSQIPTMLVSEMARQNITVALSGDGGDELFCGYNIYDSVLRGKKLDWLGGMLHSICQAPLINKIYDTNVLPEKLKMLIDNRNKATKTQFCFQGRLDQIYSLIKGPAMAIKYEIEDAFDLDNWQLRRMILDMYTYLPGDILAKVDRGSMKYSLETRCPLLDYRVLEYSFTMPHAYKYKNKDKKHILKDITYSLIPPRLLDRPKKGFSVPIAKWLKTNLKSNLIKAASKEVIEKQDIFDYSNVQKLYHDYEKGKVYDGVVWAFYVFQLWYDEYIERIL